jgi:8-oxo-dGTP pyrophosphatase MutT (NUDIX family)
MTSDARFRPSVTVAAVVARPAADGGEEYLLVEEETVDGLRLNNPAGHLEQGESPEQAVVREVLEETGCGFKASGFLGVYLSRFRRAARPGREAEDVTYLRLAFTGSVGPREAGRTLDTGIVRTLWLGYDAIVASRERHRSPLVLRCIDDHRAGRRWPLDAVQADPSVGSPEER